ncbi:MAG TPA: hypothetical protein VGI10_31300 [Polyangiaceae bacterium]|jgi:hypothetical protein
MKRNTLIGSLVFAIALGSVATLVVERVRAAGIPATNTLSYSGLLTDATGVPLTATSKNIEITLWDAVTAGNSLCDTKAMAAALTAGRFTIALDPSCTAKVHANKNIWAEVLVDGTTLGRTPLGAVPYAVETDHAVSADSATSATSATTATGALDTRIKALETGVPKVTAWTEFAVNAGPSPLTPTGSITNSSTTARWRRVGDSVQLRVETIFTGAPTPTGALFWLLPASLVGNVTSASRGNVGTARVWSGGTSLAQMCEAELTAAGNELYAYCTGAGQLTTSSPIASPFEVDFEVWYPVQGWTVTQ